MRAIATDYLRRTMQTIPVKFREYIYRLRKRSNKEEIFDILRKKFVALTPEERVRQLLMHYLIFDMKYPKGLIGVEKGLIVNGKPRRADMIVYSTEGKAFMIIECKAPGVEISQEVFDQAALYNLQMKVPYLVVSNGTTTYCCRIDWETREYVFENKFPIVEEKEKPPREKQSGFRKDREY